MQIENIKKDMEKFLKIELPEKDKNILLELLVKFQSDKKIITGNELEILRKYYEIHIMEEGNKISSRIDIENIKKLVSFVSSNHEVDSVIDESPVLKSLRIFESVNEVFLLYTPESQTQYTKLKERLEEKKIEVNGMICSIDNIHDIYNKIRELSIEEKINPENTLLDITLGQKFVGIALYKISVERGIKAINWKTDFIQKYKIEDGELICIPNRTDRFPMGVSLEIMIDPRKENYKIYEQINESIKNYNFQATAMLYSQLEEREMAQFYIELSKVYSLDIFLDWDIDEIKKSIKRFVKNVEKIELTPVLKERITKFMISMFLLTVESSEDTEDSYDLENEELQHEKKFLNSFAISRKVFESFTHYEEEEKELMIQFMIISFLKSIFRNDDKVLKILKKKTGFKLKSLDNIPFQLKMEYDLDYIEEESILEYEPSKTLKEILKTSFIFEDGVLDIGKFGIKIDIDDLSKKRELEIKKLKEVSKQRGEKFDSEKDENKNVYKEIMGKSKIALMIKTILNSKDHRIAGIHLHDLILEGSFSEDPIGYLRTACTKTKKLVNRFNEELIKIDSRLVNFIEYSDAGFNPDKGLNHSFFINQKFWKI